MFSLIRNRQALFLAALLHDIARVTAGRMRHRRFHGSRHRCLARFFGESAISPRSWCTTTSSARIAYRRDLSEEKVPWSVQYCQGLPDIGHALPSQHRRFAGHRTPGVDDWKARLLQELFQKAMNSLQRASSGIPGP